MATATGPVAIGAATSSVSGAAANPNRAGLLVFNNSSGNLFLTYGATSSTTLFSVKIGPGAYWEMPPAHLGANPAGNQVYDGAVSLIWDTFTEGDKAMVTELGGLA